jgi:hypothetical protein
VISRKLICAFAVLVLGSASSASATVMTSGVIVSGSGDNLFGNVSSYAAEGSISASGSQNGNSPSSSSANLRTGDLHAMARAARFALIPGAQSNADAMLSDTLHIIGNITGTVTGFLTARLIGDVTLGPNGTSQSSFSLAFTSGSSNADHELFPADATIDEMIAVPFDITDTSRDFSFSADLSAITQNGALGDFSDTAALGIMLPNGLSFSSGSGEFLTGVVIPEPATIWLIGAALLGLAGMLRLGRRALSGTAYLFP